MGDDDWNLVVPAWLVWEIPVGLVRVGVDWVHVWWKRLVPVWLVVPVWWKWLVPVWLIVPVVVTSAVSIVGEVAVISSRVPVLTEGTLEFDGHTAFTLVEAFAKNINRKFGTSNKQKLFLTSLLHEASELVCGCLPQPGNGYQGCLELQYVVDELRNELALLLG